MTIGIYALYWEEQDLIYIGLSQSIEPRFKEHLRDMRNQEHTNYKVQGTYNLYGNPELVIIEECLIRQLNDKEIHWTKELDTLNTRHGLNIIEAGGSGFGTSASNSKYSKWQVLKVFSLLHRTLKPHKEIAKITGVSLDSVNDISSGRKHVWLGIEYPEQFTIISNKRSIRHSNSLSSANGSNISSILIDPSGNEWVVTNISRFCKEEFPNRNNIKVNSLISAIHRVIHGDRPQYKGWKLKK